MVPEILLVRAIAVAVPEQIVCDAGVAVATGIGFTGDATTVGAPAHPLAVGVIRIGCCSGSRSGCCQGLGDG